MIELYFGLKRRQKIWVVAGVTAAALASAIGGILRPAQTYIARLDERIEAQRAHLARYEALAPRRAAAEALAARRSGSLLKEAEALARASGLTIRALRPSASSIEMETAGSMENVVAFLSRAGAPVAPFVVEKFGIAVIAGKQDGASLSARFMLAKKSNG